MIGSGDTKQCKKFSACDGKYHVYDPLTLDLDGDGIETVTAKGFSGSLKTERVNTMSIHSMPLNSLNHTSYILFNETYEK